MRPPRPGVVLPLALALLALRPLPAQDEYPPHPDAQVLPGVPQGEVLAFTFEASTLFPGTFREYWIYVPAQYDPARPACLWVNQDGIQFDAPAVFDNLIHRGEMPVTIGVFVRPGRVLSPSPHAARDRFNRSYEYDTVSDRYARFLIEELLPEVERKTASDGRPIRLSRDPHDRAIAGTSSGAIAAFGAAWERPDAFRRVFSAIGTFVGIRGGDHYPVLIRKHELRPLRVFLQDGSGDLNNAFGAWWWANQSMLSALEYAGHEVAHVWGEGAHNQRHARAIFPDVVRWLWKDWPAPVHGSPGRNPDLAAILLPGEDWELVSEGHRFTEGPAAAPDGEVFFTDIPESKVWKIAVDGAVSLVAGDTGNANGQAFGPDGRRYLVAAGLGRIVAIARDGSTATVAEGIRGNDLVVDHEGFVFVTHPPARGSTERGRVWLIRPDGSKQVVDETIAWPNGVQLSPDQTLLHVAEYDSHWVASFRILPDRTLAFKQRHLHLERRDRDDDAGADGMCVDADGRLYVATRSGIQVADQLGRVVAILPTPNGRVSNVTFGGPAFDLLHATCGDKVYRRRVGVRGVNAWAPPVLSTKSAL